jgi:hypothetical protein
MPQPSSQWRVIVIAAAVNLMSNATLIAVLFGYVKLLQENTVLRSAWFSGNARDSLLLLALVVTGIGLAFTLYAASEYVGRSAALRLARTYQEQVFRRVMYRFLEHQIDQNEGAAKITDRVPLRLLAINYAANSGWALRFIANALPAVALVGFSLCTMLWLNPLITGLLAVLGTLIIAAQYPANLFAASSTALADRLRRHLLGAFKALQDRINRTPTLPGNHEHPFGADIDAFFSAPDIARYMQANENRFRAMELSSLTMQVGGAVMMVTLFALIGLQIVVRGGDWAVLAAYIALLRLMVSNMTSVFRAITVFSRFYPYIKDLRLYLEEPTTQPATPSLQNVPPSTSHPIQLNATDLEGRASPLELVPGSVIALRAIRGYGRDLMWNLNKVICRSTPQYQEPVSCALVLSPPSSEQVGRWGSSASTVDRSRWISNLGEDSVKEALERALTSVASVLLLDRIALEALSEEDWNEWRRRLSNHVAIIVYAETIPPHPRIRPELHAAAELTDPATFRDFGETLFLVQARNNGFVWSQLPETGIDRTTFARLNSHLHLLHPQRDSQSVDHDLDPT